MIFNLKTYQDIFFNIVSGLHLFLDCQWLLLFTDRFGLPAISLIPFHQFIREYVKHDEISKLQIMQPYSSATSLMLFRLNNSFLQISYLTPFTISQEIFSDNQILPIPFPNYSYLLIFSVPQTSLLLFWTLLILIQSPSLQNPSFPFTIHFQQQFQKDLLKMHI